MSKKGTTLATVAPQRVIVKGQSGPQSDLIVKLDKMGIWGAGSALIQRVSDARALRNSIVAAAGDILSQDIGKTPFGLVRKSRKEVEVIAAEDHPWARKLMLRPNGYQTWIRFWWQAVATLSIRQEVVIYRRRKRRTDISPDLIVLQHDEWVQNTNPETGRFYYDVSASTEGRVAMLGSPSMVLTQDDVIHVMARSFNGYEGVSTLAIGSDVLGLASMVADFQAALVKSGTRPTGFISVPGKFETEQQFLEFQKQVVAAMSAATKAGEPLVLGEGAEFENIGLTASSADLVNAKQQLMKDCARLFRIPGHKLGLTEDLNRANVEAFEKAYVDDTIVPLCELIEQDFTAALLTEEEMLEGYRFIFNREELYDRDPAARRERIENQFKEGLTFLNEARRDLGREPVPEEQDHRRMPVNSGIIYRDGRVQILTHDKRDAGDAQDTAPAAPPEPKSAHPVLKLIQNSPAPPPVHVNVPLTVQMPDHPPQTIHLPSQPAASKSRKITLIKGEGGKSEFLVEDVASA